MVLLTESVKNAKKSDFEHIFVIGMESSNDALKRHHIFKHYDGPKAAAYSSWIPSPEVIGQISDGFHQIIQECITQFKDKNIVKQTQYSIQFKLNHKDLKLTAIDFFEKHEVKLSYFNSINNEEDLEQFNLLEQREYKQILVFIHDYSVKIPNPNNFKETAKGV